MTFCSISSMVQTSFIRRCDRNSFMDSHHHTPEMATRGHFIALPHITNRFRHVTRREWSDAGERIASLLLVCFLAVDWLWRLFDASRVEVLKNRPSASSTVGSCCL